MKTWIDEKVTLKEGVSREDDVLSSVSHMVGFGLAVVATVLLLLQSAGSAQAMWTSVIYGVTMCGVFGSSALYHWLRPSTAKRVFRLVDHSTIYLLIAGTYTPYAAAMGEVGNSVLLAVWGLCAVGLVLNVLLWDRMIVLHMGIYLLMGWLVIFFWSDLREVATIQQVRWMLLGGGLYTFGVFFYLYKKIPHYHFIWHLFVIGGAAGLHMGIVRHAIPAITG